MARRRSSSKGRSSSKSSSSSSRSSTKSSSSSRAKSTATKAAKEDAAKHLKVASYSLDAQAKAKPPSLDDVGSFRIYDQEYQTALMAGYALDVETSAAAYMAEEMNKNPLDGAAFANKVDSYLKKTYQTVHPSVLT